ncbi:hypothetical protein [Streptomyces sp. CC210A]|uniref:hypothetical protein n=1 Tax=Streptomyces sp. CC210A TaxID=2898184 RepID=UPI001F2D6E12|nr:hypothetical protein [Streptomyces sp. CC210A]
MPRRPTYRCEAQAGGGDTYGLTGRGGPAPWLPPPKDGYTRIDGRLALPVQRSDQTDRQLADHETRLDALERGR